MECVLPIMATFLTLLKRTTWYLARFLSFLLLFFRSFITHECCFQDCCAWHSEAYAFLCLVSYLYSHVLLVSYANHGRTCCRRKVCSGGYKPDATDDYSGKCHELLGLLNCAPCKYNAGLFFSNYTSQGNPWEEGVIAVCPSFCSELFHACYLDPLRVFPHLFSFFIYPSCLSSLNSFHAEDGEQDPMGWDCAFGPSTKCAMGDSSETGQYENTVDGQMQFCQDWGLVVREKDCYSSAMRPLPLLFSSVLALLLLALVVL
ncbi:hypothetical protein QOT17_011327 [Balamuthia mandrillaris]